MAEGALQATKDVPIVTRQKPAAGQAPGHAAVPRRMLARPGEAVERSAGARAARTLSGAFLAQSQSPRQRYAPAQGPTSLVFRCGAHACDCPAEARLRAELPVSHPRDPAELEAERTADEVMRTPPGYMRPTSMAPAAGSAHRGEAAADLASSIDDACRRGGQPLPPDSREFMESRFGSDFGMVRVHADPSAAELAHQVRARAFTTGNHVFFAAGEYLPDLEPGRHLLAHELAHVVQQHRAMGRRDNGAEHHAPANGIRPASTGPGRLSAIQRDLALEPPHPAAAGRILTPAQMTDAIDFNNHMVGVGGVGLIRKIRDVLGTSPSPPVVDEDFVNAVVTWQAMQGLTQDGKLGPITAARLFREIGAEKRGECKVKDGVVYEPAAPIAVPGGRGKRAEFFFGAEFESDPAAGVFPSCCEVRQFIRWNAAAAAGMGPTGVPHDGFPAGTPADAFIEDRDEADLMRYGHRSGPHAVLRPNNQYFDSTGAQNLAFGDTYEGSDAPEVTPEMAVGQWQFYVKVIDTCHGGVRKGNDSLIRIDWQLLRSSQVSRLAACF